MNLSSRMLLIIPSLLGAATMSVLAKDVGSIINENAALSDGDRIVISDFTAYYGKGVGEVYEYNGTESKPVNPVSVSMGTGSSIVYDNIMQMNGVYGIDLKHAESHVSANALDIIIDVSDISKKTRAATGIRLEKASVDLGTGSKIIVRGMPEVTGGASYYGMDLSRGATVEADNLNVEVSGISATGIWSKLTNADDVKTSINLGSGSSVVVDTVLASKGIALSRTNLDANNLSVSTTSEHNSSGIEVEGKSAVSLGSNSTINSRGNGSVVNGIRVYGHSTLTADNLTVLTGTDNNLSDMSEITG
ncbi:MAG: hypothetical protein ACRCTT_15140, partial [Enterobacter roggenkampii]